MTEFESELYAEIREIICDAVIEGKRRERGAMAIGDEAAVAVLKALEKVRRNRRSVKWDQAAVTEWQNATFGEPKSNLGIAIRANEEMAELLRCLARDDNDQHARTEVADVVIVLCRLVTRLGGSMVRDVDAKMEVNVARKWVKRGDGHGQHVKIEPMINTRGEALAKLSFAPDGSPVLCAKCGGTGVTSLPFEPTTVARCDCQK